jgi:hypothetical protein
LLLRWLFLPLIGLADYLNLCYFRQ